ncbi:MAG: aminoglycoside 6'-N-acetyltransferase [Cyanobacteria bacterium J06560_2]
MTDTLLAGQITEVTDADLSEWVALALKLWPDEADDEQKAHDEMAAELKGILQSPRDTGFLLRDRTNTPIAFINLSICYEYVPGATRFPVAYVEGLYVEAKNRRQGIAAHLMKRAEAWALTNGCTQMGSDVLIENEESCQFHTQVGFQEVERVVCFIKDLEQP